MSISLCKKIYFFNINKLILILLTFFILNCIFFTAHASNKTLRPLKICQYNRCNYSRIIYDINTPISRKFKQSSRIHTSTYTILNGTNMPSSMVSSLIKNFEITVPENGLAEKLNNSLSNNRPLNIKLGFDPTAPDLHLGHAVVLKKLKEFQDQGHKLKIIIGDFTASIGDPTGRNKTRPPLSKEQIEVNARTYLNQLDTIVDVNKADIFYNSEWHSKLNFSEIIHLFSQLTVSQIMQRADFNNRYNNNLPISFHELVYPIIQGYDSIMVNADIEIGGTDQLFNCMVGRNLQTAVGNSPQAVACMPLLKGIDGKMKMSKSLNNYIALTEHPNNMYGKIMSIPDELLTEYIILLSNFRIEEKIDKINALKSIDTNPMLIKKELAQDIVEQYWGEKESKNAANFFYRQVQVKNFDDINFTKININDLNLSSHNLSLLEICHKIQPTKSRSQLRRLIEGGGVSINSSQINNPNHFVEIGREKEPIKIKIGKRDFYNLIEE